MTDAETKAFNHGYLIACCNLVNGHNEPSIAADILSSAGLSRSDIEDMDLTEYDNGAVQEMIEMGGPDSPLKP